ncbi:Hypothetical protein NTJ_03531 [Nesidiocoris tenuis]|uniref:KASH domain-containing protein n=1 Tax=Nesidiocoris tenuis TaxID=355587 RepID=A0ABN7AFA3_9HEMI|nr:Hypothetical protein NTJ_03531 [Nesidiocoris tenuis]
MAILFALLIFNLELYGSSLMFFFAVPDQSKYYGTSSSSTAATTLPPHLSTDPGVSTFESPTQFSDSGNETTLLEVDSTSEIQSSVDPTTAVAMLAIESFPKTDYTSSIPEPSEDTWMQGLVCVPAWRLVLACTVLCIVVVFVIKGCSKKECAPYPYRRDRTRRLPRSGMVDNLHDNESIELV